MFTTLLLPQVQATPTAPQAVLEHIQSRSVVRSGPFSASVGPLTVQRLISRVDIIDLAVTPQSLTSVRVTGNLVAKVNGPKRPFLVEMDLGITESTCEGWFTPLAIPVALRIDLEEVSRTEGTPGVRADVVLENFTLDGLPVAEHLNFCDPTTGGLLVGAAVGWLEVADEMILQVFEDELNGYLASLQGLSLFPVEPAPSPGPVLPPVPPTVY